MSAPLPLTLDDLARLEEASRVLLSPLAAPDARAWQAEVLRAVRPVFGADHALFTESGGGFSYVGEGPGDDPVGERFERVMTVEAATSAFVDRDPYTGAWLRAFRAAGLGAYTTDAIDGWLGTHRLRIADSTSMREVMWPNGLRHGAGFVAPYGAGEAAVTVNFRAGGPAPGPAALALGRALVPAFRAGLNALGRLVGSRTALDALAEPVVAFDADGRELHRNAALVRLLDADPQRVEVEAALWRLGRDVRRLLFPRRFEGEGGVPAPMQRAAATAQARYTLSAAFVPPGAFVAGPAAIVSVAAALAARPPSPAEVSARTGLTAREAEVALLVADGLTNAEIAGRLFVAPGTVKRHVENVLAKLAAPTRAAVAARLATGVPR